MITKWDIIYRMDPKTKIVRYTLVSDGTEKDARLMAKKLGSYVLAIRKALRPYVYAYRLPNDLDEITLDKIRTAVRSIVKEADKLAQFTPGVGLADPLANAKTISILHAPEKLKEMDDPSLKKVELDLQDATIINPERFGEKVGQEKAPEQTKDDTLQVKKIQLDLPSLEVLDEQVPAQAEPPEEQPAVQSPTEEASAEQGAELQEQPVSQMPVMPDQTAEQIPVVQEQPEIQPKPQVPDTPAQNTLIGNTIIPIGGKIENEDLPDLVPQEEKESGLKQWFHDKIMAKEQKRQSSAPRPVKKQAPVAAPQQKPAPKPVQKEQAAPAPKPETPAPQVPADEKKDLPTKQQEQPAKKVQTSVFKMKKPAPKAKVVAPPKAAPADDGFPQIRVQVRPAVFDEEETKQSAAVQKPQQEKPAETTPRPAAPAAPQKAAQPTPETVQQKPQAPAPKPAAQETAQPAEAEKLSLPQVDSTLPEKKISAPKKEEASAVRVSAEEVPLPTTEPVDAPQAEKTVTTIPVQEQEIPREPLNFSLEDMFMAETKYDMFVDIDELDKQAEKTKTGKPATPKQPKKNTP